MTWFIGGVLWGKSAASPSSGENLSGKQEYTKTVFQGFIKEGAVLVRKDDTTPSDGYITDSLGTSVITEFNLTQNELTFKSKGLSDQLEILHTLKRGMTDSHGGVFYVGTWQTGKHEDTHEEETVTRGKVRCVLTSLPSWFFVEPRC